MRRMIGDAAAGAGPAGGRAADFVDGLRQPSPVGEHRPADLRRQQLRHRRSDARARRDRLGRSARRPPTLRTDAFSLAVFSVLVLAVLVYLGLYRSSFATHFLEDARTIIAATAIVAMCMTFGRVLIFDNPDAAAQAVRAWIFASTYVIAARAGRHIVEMRRRRAGMVGAARR